MKIPQSYPFILGIIFVCCFGFATLFAQNNKPTLLALSKKDHTLSIVDAISLKVLSKVSVGPDPHEVVASADGKYAYVSNTGGGQSTEINVIELLVPKTLSSFNTKPLMGPHGLAVVGDKLWFSAEGSKAVGRIDLASNTLDFVQGTGENRTHMVYVTAKGSQVYTTNVNGGTISILYETDIAATPSPEARKEWLHQVIKVNKGVEGFDVTPDGKQLWAACAEDGTIALVDLVNRKLMTTIDAKAVGANRLKITPDGKLALISSLRSGNLIVYDVSTRKEIKQLSLGKGAAGIQIEPNGARAFVACTPDNYVAIIDLKKLEVTGHLDVGGGPDGLAWVERN